MAVSTVKFMSRQSFEAFTPEEYTAYISIVTPWDRPAQPSGRAWVGGLVWFRDDDSMPVPAEETQLLVSFIETWKNFAFVVQCDAGISRSAAVALYIGARFDRLVIGLDSDGTSANAVIKAALMRHLWKQRFAEPEMSKVLGKLPDLVSCIRCAKQFKPQAFGHEVCWDCVGF